MNFAQAALTFSGFLRSHDLDPNLYTIRITTHSPIALDQLRLALSSDYKHLFCDTDRWPRNHFVGRFQANGVSFRTGLVEREPFPFPQANVGPAG
jgi:hypothetical protein